MFERYKANGDVIYGTVDSRGMVKYGNKYRYSGDPTPSVMHATIEAYLSESEPIDMGNGLPPEPESIPADDVVERLTPWMTPMQSARWWYKWGPEGYARKEWLAWADRADAILSMRIAKYNRAETENWTRRMEWLSKNNRPLLLRRR